MKIGDFFRAVRSYEADLKDPVDSLSFKAAIAEDTQKKTPSVDPAMFTKGNGPVIHVRDLPRRAVGEIVIIGVTNTTATGMIVFCLGRCALLATTWKPTRCNRGSLSSRSTVRSRGRVTVPGFVCIVLGREQRLVQGGRGPFAKTIIARA